MNVKTTFPSFVFLGIITLSFLLTTTLSAEDDNKKQLSKETPYPQIFDETPHLEYRLDFKQGSLNDMLDMAKSSKRSVFVHTTSNSCNACDYLANSLYTDTDVAAFYNENFVNYIMDVDDVQHVNFARMHDLGGRPMLMYLNARGEILRKEDQITNAQQLISAGNNAIYKTSHIASNKANLDNMHAKYQKNYKDPSFLYEYAYMLKSFDEPYNAIVNEYLRTQKNISLKDKRNRKFLYDFSDNLENTAIDYFIRDAGYFKTIMGGQKINDKLKSAIYNSVQTAIKERDVVLFEKAKQILRNCNLPNSSEFIFYIETEFYEGIRSWGDYVKITTKYFNEYNVSDPHMLNYAAYKFARFVEPRNKSAMKNAIAWAEKSIRIDFEYYNHVTLALLHYKIGNFRAAEKVAKKAIEIAQIRNQFFIDRNINKRISMTDARRLIDKIRSRGLLDRD